jgi:hypothetical protein
VNRFLESLSKEKLIEYIEILSKNFLTLDGYWFLGVEDRFGQNAAIEIDEEAWGKYAVSEARRVKDLLKAETWGLPELGNALQLISMAHASGFEVALSADSLMLSVGNCRPQTARIRSGKGEFPCRTVGIAHLATFAKELNPRFRVKCIQCPPERSSEDAWCIWEFTLA